MLVGEYFATKVMGSVETLAHSGRDAVRSSGCLAVSAETATSAADSFARHFYGAK